MMHVSVADMAVTAMPVRSAVSMHVAVSRGVIVDRRVMVVPSTYVIVGMSRVMMRVVHDSTDRRADQSAAENVTQLVIVVGPRGSRHDCKRDHGPCNPVCS